LLRKKLNDYSNLAHNLLILLHWIINVSFLWIAYAGVYVFIYAIGTGFVAFICPFLLIWVYQYKKYFFKNILVNKINSDIQGPWDLPRVVQYTHIY